VHLKSLTLKGFKSFAAPTTFAFEPGVTCVVGPNGSGKSNVVDALAWVMGEQGAKNLRGGTMADVIFAGTSTRGPLGRAQVVLTIDNADGALPIEYAEVTISRTLFRAGGSEYAINGEACRLLDVQELLSDTGLGREMHVIVGQGQLDAVLHATPEDRRGFVEEAAGILKHRRRKEKTLRKLEGMQANLTRLSDLAGELRRQLKPLGRQAEVAREAGTIAAVVRDAKARLLADDVVALQRGVAAATSGEAARRAERVELDEQLDEAKLREQGLEQAMVGDVVDRARRTAFELEAVQERLRGLSGLAQQRLRLLAEQAERPQVAPTVGPGAVEDAREEAVRLEGDVRGAEEALARASVTTRGARTALDALDEEISAQAALVSAHDLEVLQLRGALDVAGSRAASARADLDRRRQAAQAAAVRRDEARAERDSAEADAPAGADDDGTDHASRRRQAEEAVRALQDRVDDLRDRAHAAERERDALAARHGALSLALDRRDGSAALVAAGRPGVRGLVAEHVQVVPGWEAAVAAALGSLVDGVLADDLEAALGAVEHATDADLGRVELVVAAPARPVPHAPAGLPEGVLPAAAVVSAPAGVLALLASTVVADDLDAARAAWPVLAAHDVPLTVLTRAGEVLGEHVLRGGTGAERSRLELVAERDAAASGLATVSAAHEALTAELQEARGDLGEARTAEKAAAAAAREHEAGVTAHEQRVARLRSRVEVVEAEADRVEATLAGAETAVAEAESAAGAARHAHETAAARPRPVLDASARDALADEVEVARHAEVEARVALETARERVRAEVARAEALQRQLDEQRAAAEEAARRAVVRARERAVTTAVLDALPPVLDSVARSLADARTELAAAEAERARQSAELAALRRDERGLRDRLQAVTESVHGFEMELHETRLHLTGLLGRAASELGLDEDVLVAEYGPDVPVRDVPAGAGGGGRDLASDADDDAEADPHGTGEADGSGVPYVRAEQQARLARAEQQLVRLGRVNPLALEEYAALEQRHRFLTEQLADLTRTRTDLLAIIDEIDEKMRTVFASAFEDTRDAFDRVFPVLFPGGSGSIHLTDPDDLLATGIEVTVRPAGKKIERLSLLSGGERSLAAVALLIAIFKARPSPFYIMDEVEAALDDANLGRLLAVFEDLRETSQLIVVTHQKRTMEIADALYGVSMRQDGVSAVVGQRVVERA